MAEPGEVEALVDSLTRHMHWCEAHNASAVEVTRGELVLLLAALRTRTVGEGKP